MFVCRVPRDSAEFVRLLNVEQKLFEGLSIPPAMAQNFFRLRPELFTAIIASDDSVAAYTIALPLQPRWAEAFIAGDITETELTPGMLLERNQSLEGANIYIASVVVSDRYDPLTKLVLIAGLLSWRIKQLQSVAVSQLSVIMTPVTEQGERLARFAGATLLNSGINRKDGYAVCGREVTSGFLSRAATAMERCLNGAVIRINFDAPLNAGQPEAAAINVEAGVKAKASSPAHAFGGMVSFANRGLRNALASLRIGGVGVSIAIMAMTTAALFDLNTFLAVDHLGLVYALPIILIGLRYGTMNAIMASIFGGLAAAFFLYEPVFSFYIDDPHDILEVALIFVMALATSHFVGKQSMLAMGRLWGRRS